jgi:preprotein translocase subunit SecA
MVRPLVPAAAGGDGQGNGKGDGRSGGVVAAARPLAASPMAGVGAPGRSLAKPASGPGGVKLGRNDACWCGSGKKYKRCHGA